MTAATITFKELVIDSMDDLGLYYTTTLDVNTEGAHIELTVAGLHEVSQDDEKMRWWYVAQASDLGVFRLIKSTTLTADDKLLLTRGFPSQVLADAVLHFFLILSPREVRRAVNNALNDKFVDTRTAVTLAADTTEYNLTTTITDLLSKGQLKRIVLRDVSNGSSQPIDKDIPVQDVYDDNGEVKLLLPSSWGNIASRTLEIEYRKYYATLSSDSDTVNLVRELMVRAACKHEILKMVFLKLGPAAKRNFGQAMVLAEKDLAEQETKALQVETRKAIQTTRSRLSGDPLQDMNWTW